MSSKFDKIEGIENLEKIDDGFNGFEDGEKIKNLIFRSADKNQNLASINSQSRQNLNKTINGFM